MGRLELPLPEFGKAGTGNLKTAARNMEAKIRAQTPVALRESIVVRTFKKGGGTGIEIEYDDRAENFVYIAMEFPRPGRREETITPRK